MRIQNAGAEQHAEQRIAPARRRDETQQHAGHDPWQRDRVRKDLMFEIDPEERDQDAHEQQPADQQRTERRDPHHQHKQQRRDQLDDRILNRNRVPRTCGNGRAASSQPKIRNVVVPLQSVAALRAPRWRRHDRLPQRHAVDHDVEEAADARRRTRPAAASTAPGVTARCPRSMAWPPSGSGNKRGAGPEADAAGRGIERNTACRCGSTGMPRQRSIGGRPQATTRRAAAVPLGEVARLLRLSSSIASMASSCCNRWLALRLHPVHLGRCRAVRSTVGATTPGCRPPRAWWRPAARATVAAPGISPAFLNHSAARA